MKKVLIGGPMYGCKNIGDEAILSSIIKMLRKIDIPLEITVLTQDLNNTAKKYGVKTYPLFGRRNYLTAIWKTDFFICGGATILSDCSFYSLGLVRWAKFFGKKIIIFCVGMDPIFDKKKIRFISKNCNKAKVITVRDKDVKRRLEEYGVNRPIFATVDPAICTESCDDERIKKIFKKNQLDFGSFPIIGIGISGEKDVRDITPIDEIAKISDHLIEKMKFKVLFIPTNLREEQDIDLMKKIINTMKRKDEAKILKYAETPEEVVGVVSKLSLIVSSRLHLLIFSTIADVPFIGLSRCAKIDSYLARFGEKAVCSVKEITFEKLIFSIEKIWENRNSFKNKIKYVKIVMEQENKLNEEILRKFIKDEDKF